MTRKLVLFGDGQVAAGAFWQITHESPVEVAGFTVDAAYRQHEQLFDLPVTPFEEVVERFPPDEFDMLVTISYRATNRLRAEKYAQAKAKGYQLFRYMSPRAITWEGLETGDNLYVRALASIEPFVLIGNDVVIGPGVFIGHNGRIGDHCYIAARATISGDVSVGPYCLLGTNCTVRDGVKIAERCIIGAGAVIRHDTEPGGVYRASPAEKLDRTSDQLTHI
jgi:sugar O-acyltransferase (sialic acid O-acetyltransferase NeuD family)